MSFFTRNSYRDIFVCVERNHCQSKILCVIERCFNDIKIDGLPFERILTIFVLIMHKCISLNGFNWILYYNLFNKVVSNWRLLFERILQFIQFNRWHHIGQTDIQSWIHGFVCFCRLQRGTMWYYIAFNETVHRKQFLDYNFCKL